MDSGLTGNLDGPDFFCVGMAKAGTGWLYSNCRHHPDFWMPPIKELHYLDREIPNIKKIKRGRTEKDRAFMAEIDAANNQPRDFDRYVRFFRFKDGLLSGDVSPTYAIMQDDAIAMTMNRFPKLKVILLVRDPISRAWSHFSMLVRSGKALRSTLENADEFRELLKESKVAIKGEPSRIYERWSAHVPDEQMRVYFYDDISEDPPKVMERIFTFLGADPKKETERDAAENRKSGKEKVELTPAVRQVLLDRYGQELQDCAKVLGGPAIEWARKYGVTV